MPHLLSRRILIVIPMLVLPVLLIGALAHTIASHAGPVVTGLPAAPLPAATASFRVAIPCAIRAAIPAATPAGNARYVAPNGNDSNPGSLASPWKTIGKAARTVVAGDTVYIRGGIYQELVAFAASGTASQPIRILAYPGEVPVVDGNNFALPTADWGVLFQISGNYVQVSGLEVRFSNWIAVSLLGQHDSVNNMNVHDNKENGILVSGDYGAVENCDVWRNDLSNVNGSRSRTYWSTGLSAARDPKDGLTSYAILRGNKVHENWGEGLSSFEADGTLMENNVVYDNYATDIYISDTTNAVVQRNLVYFTPNGPMGSYGSQIGIGMGDEQYKPASANNVVINNLVYGANRNFMWWQGSQGGGLVNTVIANNTFVNAKVGSSANFQIGNGTHSNSRVSNNIIQQDTTVAIALVGTGGGLTISNNLWSRNPGTTARGGGSIIADPQLAKTGTIAAGVLTGDYFRPLLSSPARDAALLLSQVGDDFFHTARGASSDIGAIEH